MTTHPLHDADKLKTKYRLLEVAARHIALHGVAATSLRAIAAEAGVSAAAIYRHYPGGKADLHAATLGMVAEAVARLVWEEPMHEEPLAEALVRRVALFWDFCAEHGAIAALVVRENVTGGPDGPSPFLGEHLAAIAELRKLLERAIAAGELRSVNVSSFLFWVTTYVTSFHGCRALRDAVWTKRDLGRARQTFLEAVRAELTPPTRAPRRRR
ncbi:MAG: TetR/AcrR family transcriptional regulator [bacterium]